MKPTPRALAECNLLARRSGIIAKACKLPPFPSAALRLLAVSTDSDSAVDDFEAAFKLDPGLAASLLVAANSPLFAFQTRTAGIRQAIARLGLDMVRSLALTLGMRMYVIRAGTVDAVESVWRHSVATAVIAEVLARYYQADPSVLYTAGLLHDVGRLALLSLEGDRYAEIMSREHFNLEESLLLEMLTFGCTHDDVGAFLCRSWGFPEGLCDCVRFHHQAVSAQAGVLPELIGLACPLAGLLEAGEVKCAEPHGRTLSDVLPASLADCAELQPEALRRRIAFMSCV